VPKKNITVKYYERRKEKSESMNPWGSRGANQRRGLAHLIVELQLLLRKEEYFQLPRRGKKKPLDVQKVGLEKKRGKILNMAKNAKKSRRELN